MTLRVVRMALLALWVGGASWVPLWPAGASAEQSAGSELPRLAVERFHGPGAARAQRVVEGALAKDSRVDLAQAEDGSAAFALQGKVSRGPRGWRLELRLSRQAETQSLSLRTLTGRSPRAVVRQVRAGVGDWVAGELAGARARTEARDGSQADRTDPESASAGRRPRSRSAPVADAGSGSEQRTGSAPGSGPSWAGERTALHVAAGVRLFGRDFRYRDDLFDSLADYRLRMGPEIVLRGQWYPAAHFTAGAAGSFGVELSFAHSVGLDSTGTGSESNARRGTRSLRYGVGLRGRHRWGPVRVHGTFGYGAQRFEVEEGASEPLVPDVAYRHLRFAAGASVILWERVTLAMELAWLHLLHVGQLGSQGWFAGASGAGFEGRLGIRVRIAAGVELQLTGQWRRYFFSLDPEPGDARVAGGAVDQYPAVTLGLGWRY
jgi:hypothetical protein